MLQPGLGQTIRQTKRQMHLKKRQGIEVRRDQQQSIQPARQSHRQHGHPGGGLREGLAAKVRRIDLGIPQGGESAHRAHQSPLQPGFMDQGTPEGEQGQQATGRNPVAMDLLRSRPLTQGQGGGPVLIHETACLL
ncbi:hypothetical protein D3C72_1925890 [compost metagenome]